MLCSQERILQDENFELKRCILDYVKETRTTIVEQNLNIAQQSLIIETLTESANTIPELERQLNFQAQELEALREYKKRAQERDAQMKVQGGSDTANMPLKNRSISPKISKAVAPSDYSML